MPSSTSTYKAKVLRRSDLQTRSGQKPTLDAALSPLLLPKSWNIIPTAIRVSLSLDSFRRHLKTHYFASPGHPHHLTTAPHLWFNFLNLGALPNILHYITIARVKSQFRTPLTLIPSMFLQLCKLSAENYYFLIKNVNTKADNKLGLCISLGRIMEWESNFHSLVLFFSLPSISTPSLLVPLSSSRLHVPPT